MSKMWSLPKKYWQQKFWHQAATGILAVLVIVLFVWSMRSPTLVDLVPRATITATPFP